jgi:poly-gamma-glutamate synthesis protein (capsule biosynthesis protein)
VTLAAVGDILLDRGVGRRIAARGPGYPFAHATASLRSADIAFGNIECPVSDEGKPAPKPFSFRASRRAASGLADAGFDVLSLANNHTLDCGRSGLADTMAFLRTEGIAWCGAGATASDAAAPRVLRRKGIRVALVGFCDIVQDASYPRSDLPGIAQASQDAVANAVRRARRMADAVVVSIHWGIEFTPRPTARQRALAVSAARAGADLVIGHHPHVLQGLQWVRRSSNRGALVAYSLGNFVFDPLRSPSNRTVVLTLSLGRTGVRDARVTPWVIDDCRPKPAPADIAAATLARIEELSREMGTRVVKGRLYRTAYVPRKG